MTPLHIQRIVETHAHQTPTASALLAPQCAPLSYGRLYDLIQETNRTLTRLGIGRRDRLAVVLPNGPEMATAFLAVASCAVCAPLNPGYKESEFDFYLSDLDVRALIIQAGDTSPARTAA